MNENLIQRLRETALSAQNTVGSLVAIAQEASVRIEVLETANEEATDEVTRLTGMWSQVLEEHSESRNRPKTCHSCSKRFPCIDHQRAKAALQLENDGAERVRGVDG